MSDYNCVPVMIEFESGGASGWYLVEDAFTWAYTNNFELPGSQIEGSGHPPYSMWKGGKYDPFSVRIVIPAGKPVGPLQSGLGWAKDEEEVVEKCQALAKSCLPQGEEPGKMKAPGRLILMVGGWFKLIGYPQTMKIAFKGPWGGDELDKPMFAEVEIGCLPSAKALSLKDKGEKWVVNNTWHFTKMH